VINCPLANGKSAALMIREARTINVIPVAVIAEYGHHSAGAAPCPLAVFEGDIDRFMPLIGTPEEAMLVVNARVSDRCPNAPLLLRERNSLLQ
jgi:hypothetical protein